MLIPIPLFVTRDPDRHAECAGSDIHHPPRDAAPEVVEFAQAMCDACPVVAECREYAITAPQHPHGIWGGLTEEEIETARAQRGVRDWTADEEEAAVTALAVVPAVEPDEEDEGEGGRWDDWSVAA